MHDVDAIHCEFVINQDLEGEDETSERGTKRHRAEGSAKKGARDAHSQPKPHTKRTNKTRWAASPPPHRRGEHRGTTAKPEAKGNDKVRNE